MIKTITSITNSAEPKRKNARKPCAPNSDRIPGWHAIALSPGGPARLRARSRMGQATFHDTHDTGLATTYGTHNQVQYKEIL